MTCAELFATEAKSLIVSDNETDIYSDITFLASVVRTPKQTVLPSVPLLDSLSDDIERIS